MNIVRIRVDNVYGKILDPIPEKVFKELREECSYISKQLAYSSRQYGYHPHPTYRFSKTMVFRVGLLSRVQTILRSHNILSHIQLEDVDDVVGSPISISSDFKLRDYQLGSVDDILKRKKTAHEIATGGGKTIIMGDAIAKVGLKTTILTNSTVLMYQTAKLLGQMLNIEIGLVGDSIFNPKDVTVAMVQSLEGVYDKEDASPNRGDKISLIEATRFLVVDECHRIAAKTIFDLSGGFKNAKYAAFFTATMRRLDGKDLDLEAASGPINYSVPMARLMDEGWLVRPIVYFLNVPERKVPSNRSYLTTTKIYNDIREFYIDTNDVRNEIIAAAAFHLLSLGHSVLISVRHIEHGNRLHQLLPSSIEIYGDTYNRVQLFDDFKRGDKKMAISTLCGEGFDMPSLTAVIIANDTQDDAQIIGRVVRLNPGKSRAVVVRLDDSYHHIFKNHIRSNSKAVYKPQKLEVIKIQSSEEINYGP